jgi:U3 small nucleolar ribonucleoprotein component
MGEDIGAAVVRAWKHVAGGGRLKHPREAGPIKETPSAHEDDIRFIGNASILSKWQGVEYYGPGKEEAEARRAERLGLVVSTEEKMTRKELKAEKKALKREAAALREQLKKLRGE